MPFGYDAQGVYGMQPSDPNQKIMPVQVPKIAPVRMPAQGGMLPSPAQMSPEELAAISKEVLPKTPGKPPIAPVQPPRPIAPVKVPQQAAAPSYFTPEELESFSQGIMPPSAAGKTLGVVPQQSREINPPPQPAAGGFPANGLAGMSPQQLANASILLGLQQQALLSPASMSGSNLTTKRFYLNDPTDPTKGGGMIEENKDIGAEAIARRMAMAGGVFGNWADHMQDAKGVSELLMQQALGQQTAARDWAEKGRRFEMERTDKLGRLEMDQANHTLDTYAKVLAVDPKGRRQALIAKMQADGKTPDEIDAVISRATALNQWGDDPNEILAKMNPHAFGHLARQKQQQSGDGPPPPPDPKAPPSGEVDTLAEMRKAGVHNISDLATQFKDNPEGLIQWLLDNKPEIVEKNPQLVQKLLVKHIAAEDAIRGRVHRGMGSHASFVAGSPLIAAWGLGSAIGDAGRWAFGMQPVNALGQLNEQLKTVPLDESVSDIFGNDVKWKQARELLRRWYPRR